jgi:hypothetical protein
MKKIHKNDITGEKGVSLVKRMVLDKGFLFDETGQVEAGIDGQIEIRDKETGEVKNSIIRVQVKATENDFRSETKEGFTFYCNEDDIKYWLSGNTPVIIIVTRPKTNEAYWKSIKDYFDEPNKIKSKKVIFDKKKDDFEKAYEELIEISVDKDSGTYFAVERREETLISNLLKIEGFTEKIYSADTMFRNHNEIFKLTKTDNVYLRGEWLLWNKRIWSFYDISKYPWNRYCDSGNVETHYTNDWANSAHPDLQKNFRWLIYKAIQQKFYELGIYQHRDLGYYYFKSSNGNSPRKIKYRTHSGRNSTITVFEAKPNPINVKYYRHNAVRCSLVNYNGEWFLELTPTYHYTWDGKNLDKYYEEKLKKIKRIEKNRSVLSQVELWASVLRRDFGLQREESFIQFGKLLEFDVDFGINEEYWSDFLSEKNETEIDNLPLFNQ